VTISISARKAAFVVLLAATICPAWAGEANAEKLVLRPENILPSNTVFYYYTSPWKKWSEALGDCAPARLMREPEVARFFSEPLRLLKARMGWEEKKEAADPNAPTPLSWFDRVLKAAPGPMMMAVCRGGDVKTDAQPVYLLIIGLDEGLADQVRLFNLAVSQVRTTVAALEFVETTEYDDTKLVSVRWQKQGLTVAVRRGLLICTFGVDKHDLWLNKTVLEGLVNPKEANYLAGETAFKELGFRGDELESAYLDTAALRAVMGGVAEPVKTPGLPLSVVRRVGLGWSINNGAFHTTVGLNGSGGPCGNLLSEQSVSPEALRLCSPKTPLAVAVRVKAGEMTHFLNELTSRVPYASLPALRKEIGEWAQTPEGAPVFKKFKESLGEEIVLTLAPEAVAPFDRDELVLGVMLKNSADAESAWNEMLAACAKKQGGEVVTDKIEGAVLSWLKLPNRGLTPVSAFLGDRLLLTRNALTMRRVLAFLKTPVVENSPFLTAANAAPACALVYMDWAALYRQQYELFGKGLRMAEQYTGLPSKLGLDFNLMWSPETAAKHLSPGTLRIRRTSNGLTFSGSGPLPTPEVMAPPLKTAMEVVRGLLGGEKTTPVAEPAGAPQ
jgi:hypothetical protein